MKTNLFRAKWLSNTIKDKEEPKWQSYSARNFNINKTSKSMENTDKMSIFASLTIVYNGVSYLGDLIEYDNDTFTTFERSVDRLRKGLFESYTLQCGNDVVHFNEYILDRAIFIVKRK